MTRTTVAVGPDRLRDPRDVAAVLRSRQHRAGRLAVLQAQRRDDDGPPRIAFVASRKVGNAVTRNRAKRLLREAARRVRWEPGVDVVLIARRECATSRMGVVADELGDLASALAVGRPGATS